MKKITITLLSVTVGLSSTLMLQAQDFNLDALLNASGELADQVKSTSKSDSSNSRYVSAPEVKPKPKPKPKLKPTPTPTPKPTPAIKLSALEINVDNSIPVEEPMGYFKDAEPSLGVSAVESSANTSLPRANIREFKAPQIVGKRVPEGWTVKTLPGYKFRRDAVFKLTDGQSYRVQGEPFVLVPTNGRTSVNADTIRVLDSFIKVQDQLFAELENKLVPGTSPEL